MEQGQRLMRISTSTVYESINDFNMINRREKSMHSVASIAKGYQCSERQKEACMSKWMKRRITNKQRCVVWSLLPAFGADLCGRCFR